MALKPDRTVIQEDLGYYVLSLSGPSTTRMERGGILCQVSGTPGSGNGMDASAQAAEYAANPSGLNPVGILMNDFVNVDQSRQQVNKFKSEQQVGTKAVVLIDGVIVTNMLASTAATGNTMPQLAYAGASGLLTNISGAGVPLIGQFLTKQDSDGYAKVRINL